MTEAFDLDVTPQSNSQSEILSHNIVLYPIRRNATDLDVQITQPTNPVNQTALKQCIPFTYIEELTELVISYEIYETSLWQVS